MNAKDYFDAGNLAEAIRVAAEEVKQQPMDAARRLFLAGLLCFDGQLERADKQLDAISSDDQAWVTTVALWRRLVRGELARRQCFAEGRLPEFLDVPGPALQAVLQGLVELREGKPAAAAERLAQAEEARPRLKGTCNGQAFDDWRDLDDVAAPLLEVIMANGSYYWLPLEAVEALHFDPPRAVLDLLWRTARLTLREGPEISAFVPVLYIDSHLAAEDALKLGRATQWQTPNAGPVRGIGQRMFLVGDAQLTVLELGSVQLEGA